ncbi:MAG: hypothetical protein ACI9LM_003246 [Alteromonadaceae bacterium]
MGLLFSHSVYALNQVTASVDKNPVMVKESLVLTIIADDDINTNALDTSSLLQDFIVGRTSVSSQTSMVNFNTTRTTTWTTVLVARQEGDFTIPAFTIEGLKTQPLSLTVVPENDSRATKQQDIFITTDISSSNVYVQQQITLTVKLHFSAELKRGSLTEPSLEYANITQIGKDKESDAIINGRRYRVIERVYAINPQQSGDFVLQSPVFSGEIMVPSTRRSNFLSFAESKPVSVIGDDISLTVKPIADNYQGVWLPSELLAIHQEWQPKKETFTVGEPITRTITLTAAGLSEEQLPDINMEMPKGLKVYPDQAELHTGMNNNQLVSQKVRNFALVASKAGSYQLPEIIIPWWNTVTNKYQEAVIPAQTITVLPNVDEPINVAAVNDNSLPKGKDIQEIKPEKIIITQSSWLQWLFLSLWLITSLAWFISVRRSKKSAARAKTTIKMNTTYFSLSAACKKNNGAQALKLIVPWVNTLAGGSRITTLNDAIKQVNSSDFTLAINELQQCYYAKDNSEWQGKKLLNAITEINKSPLVSNPQQLVLNP